MDTLHWGNGILGSVQRFQSSCYQRSHLPGLELFPSLLSPQVRADAAGSLACSSFILSLPDTSKQSINCIEWMNEWIELVNSDPTKIKTTLFFLA